MPLEKNQALLKNVRISFCNDLFTPGKDSTAKDGSIIKGDRSATFLMDRESKDFKKNRAALEKARDAAIEKAWGSSPPKIQSQNDLVQDGDEFDYDGYEGCDFVKSRSKNPIKVIDKNKAPLTETDGKPIAGNIVNAVVTIVGQKANPEYKSPNKIKAYLNAVQFVDDDGVVYGAKQIDTDEVFDDLSDGDEFSDTEI